MHLTSLTSKKVLFCMTCKDSIPQGAQYVEAFHPNTPKQILCQDCAEREFRIAAVFRKPPEERVPMPPELQKYLTK